jgi:PPOX class probable F420-dependent enzyme
MARMTDGQREAFLGTPRIGMLSTLNEDGSPVTVPVWFEWDGRAVRVFSSVTSGKVRRLGRDARASLLVANSVGEPEQWVAFDGVVKISTEGAIELAERLAQRYWDMNDAGHRRELESWLSAAAGLRVLELAPARVRTSKG